MMIGMDDIIDFFGKLEDLLNNNLEKIAVNHEIDKDFSKRYMCAMNRLRYERDKAVGVKKKKIKKLYGVGYIESCGNCGFDLSVSPQYKFCPNCGYMIKDYFDLGERRTKMRKYGKLTKEEIKKQFDMMVESAKKEVDKGKNGEDYAFAIGNEALEMLRGNIEYFDYINLEAKQHIKEIIQYAAQKN